MRKLSLFLSIISLVYTSNAQDKEKECLADADQISKLIEAKSFNDAAIKWLEISEKCTNLNEQFYKNGEIIFEYQKEMSNSAEAKKAVVYDIINVFDKYDYKFPDNKNGNAIKKAVYLSEYQLGKNDDIYSTLDRAFKKDKTDFKNPKAFYLYFDSFVNQFKTGKKGITVDDLYNKHFEISEKIADDTKSLLAEIAVLTTKKKSAKLTELEQTNLLKKNETIESLRIVLEGTKAVFEPFVVCENLKKYCNNSFERNQNNAFWLTYISEYLFSKSCVTDPIVEKIVSQSYQINPSSKAAFNYGYLMFLKNDIQKSTDLFNEAAEKAENNIEKAKVFYTMASIVYGNNKQKSYEYSQKAVVADPSFGRGYLFQVQLIESGMNECYTTEFEKKSIYWLLAATVEKAGKAEKILEPSSKTRAENYLKKAPTAAEIKAAGLKTGKKITIKCWINQSFEIPNTK